MPEVTWGEEEVGFLKKSHVNINSSEIDRVFSGNIFRDFSNCLMFILLLGPETHPNKNKYHSNRYSRS